MYLGRYIGPFWISGVTDIKSLSLEIRGVWEPLPTIALSISPINPLSLLET